MAWSWGIRRLLGNAFVVDDHGIEPSHENAVVFTGPHNLRDLSRHLIVVRSYRDPPLALYLRCGKRTFSHLESNKHFYNTHEQDDRDPYDPDHQPQKQDDKPDNGDRAPDKVEEMNERKHKEGNLLVNNQPQ